MITGIFTVVWRCHLDLILFISVYLNAKLKNNPMLSNETYKELNQRLDALRRFL